MPGFIETIETQLKNFKQKIGGDIKGIFFVDLSDSSVQVTVSNEDIEYIGTAIAETLTFFESRMDAMGGQFSSQTMELLSLDDRIFSIRILKDDNTPSDYVICVVSSNKVNSSAIKKIFEGSCKEEIRTAIKDAKMF